MWGKCQGLLPIKWGYLTLLGIICRIEKMDNEEITKKPKKLKIIDLKAIVKKTSIEEVFDKYLVPEAIQAAYDLLGSSNEKIRFDQVKDVLDRAIGKKGNEGSQTLNIMNFDPEYLAKPIEMARKVLSGIKAVDEKGVGDD